MTQPLVSILITNYNYGRFLSDAIDSALQQTYPEVEVIVVDDGSQDSSHEVIASYGQRIRPVLKQNGGQASAFNAGFKVSQGEIIFLLDSDDLFEPEKVEKVIRVFHENPKPGWCFHPVNLVASDAQTLIETATEFPEFECDLREPIKRGKINGVFPKLKIPPTSGLCFRRSVLEKILPMPESIRITSDTYLQLASLSFSPGFVLGQPLVKQRIHGNNAYTRKPDQRPIKAKIHVLTADGLRRNFPVLQPTANNFISSALSLSWQVGLPNEECQKLLKEYLNSLGFLSRSQVFLKAVYYYLKYRWTEYRSILLERRWWFYSESTGSIGTK
ncbi:MAG: glycosyltransferase family 2 protein [Microcoleaceae cyanobacterium]